MLLPFQTESSGRGRFFHVDTSPRVLDRVADQERGGAPGINHPRRRRPGAPAHALDRRGRRIFGRHLRCRAPLAADIPFMDVLVEDGGSPGRDPLAEGAAPKAFNRGLALWTSPSFTARDEARRGRRAPAGLSPEAHGRASQRPRPRHRMRRPGGRAPREPRQDLRSRPITSTARSSATPSSAFRRSGPPGTTGLGHHRRDVRTDAGVSDAKLPRLPGCASSPPRQRERDPSGTRAARRVRLRGPFQPSLDLLCAVKLARGRPVGLTGVAFLYGYVWAAVRRVDRVPDPDFRRFARWELRQRILRSLHMTSPRAQL